MPTWTNQSQSTLAGSGGVVGGSLGADLVAASSVAVTDFVHFVSGSATINTITGGIARPQEIYLIPKTGSTWTLGSSGNIKAFSGTPAFDRPVHLVWDGSTSWREVAPPLPGAFATFTPVLTASAGTFSTAGLMTARYWQIGKLATVIFEAESCSISATPVSLFVAIPGGLISTNRAYSTFPFTDSATSSVGWLHVNAAGTVIELNKSLAAPAWPVTSGSGIFGFTFSFEVQ